jgi:hypothetical protein
MIVKIFAVTHAAAVFKRSLFLKLKRERIKIGKKSFWPERFSKMKKNFGKTFQAVSSLINILQM